jgi:RNA polymerase sigma-70 factor (ECF subfamily)
VLTLVAWHGLAAPDAARVLGCSRAAFAVRLHRARRRLERALGEAADVPPSPAPRLLTGREVTR